jgi:hypothetical protein
MVFIWYSWDFVGKSYICFTQICAKADQDHIHPKDRSKLRSQQSDKRMQQKKLPTIKLRISISISFYILISIYIYISLSLSIDLSIKVNIYYHTIYIYRMHMSTRGFFIPVPGSLGPWVVPRWKAPDHQSPPSLVPTILIFEAPEGLERGGFTVNEVDIYICLFTFIIYIYRYSDTIYVDVSMKWAYQPSSI